MDQTASLLCGSLSGQDDHVSSILPYRPGAEQDFWIEAGQLELGDVSDEAFWLYRKASL